MSSRPLRVSLLQFMSDHKSKMTDAVAMACNKTYRLWLRRHPDFEAKGRVHVIAHSVGPLSSLRCSRTPTTDVDYLCVRQLGSALVSEILSEQATTLPKMSSLPKQVRPPFTSPLL